ncbi:MAG: glycosyltransferase family 39 protein [Polyangiaceae bacterium]
MSEPRAVPEFLQPRSDWGRAWLLGIAYVALLYFTSAELGYARDEGFYFYAADAYEQWFRLLVSEPMSALSRAQVDRFWAVNHEHPSMMKVLFVGSHQLFHETLGWMRPGVSYRFPAMLMGGLGIGLVHQLGAKSFGRLAGMVAALCFAFMPRVFFHAHLACFDVPVTTMWLLCAYAYLRSLEEPGKWAYRTALCYGLLLETKHNAWLFPAVLVAHTLLSRLGDYIGDHRRGRPYVPKAFFTMALVSPLVFYALWPWLWYDPLHRFLDYVRFHTQHEYYNMEFLGKTYWKPPMPLGYAWLMTVATVPATTLLLAFIGVMAWLFERENPPANEPAPSTALAKAATKPGDKPAPKPLLPPRPAPRLFFFVAMLVAYAPWWSSSTPIFGGTKHWLTAYPFLALLAGGGFQLVAAALHSFDTQHRVRERLKFSVPMLGALAVVAVSAVMALRVHPFGLSAYTPVVGGAPGAATMGLNRTFWGYTTGSLTDFIDEHGPRSASVYVHDTALPSWDMLRADGRIRDDLHGSLSIAGSSLAIYHHEPHMSRVEYQIWVDYGTLTPAAMLVHDGVPVTWIYERE